MTSVFGSSRGDTIPLPAAVAYTVASLLLTVKMWPSGGRGGWSRDALGGVSAQRGDDGKRDDQVEAQTRPVVPGRRVAGACAIDVQKYVPGDVQRPTKGEDEGE